MSENLPEGAAVAPLQLAGHSTGRQAIGRESCVSSDLMIRTAAETDAERLAEIYNWYVLNATATFETAAVTSAEMQRRIQERLARHDWIIGEVNQQTVGYAYYGHFRTRAAYAHTVESTVYLSKECTGKGFGKSLYAAVIDSAKRKGFREMIGVIALPNPASIRLHRASGFSEAGVLRRVGRKFDRDVDIGIWQLSLDAR
jgi:L-amino acid N-acyltransferase YncA